jgi:hypothetical protein
MPVECDYELYCSFRNKACANQKKLNQNCDDVESKPLSDREEGENFMVICQGGSKCRKNPSQTNATCQPIFNSKIGEECTDYDDCEFSLDCLNGKCIQPEIKPIPCGNTNCTSLNNEQCICNPGGVEGTCKTVMNTCDAKFYQKEWMNCWRDNNCHYDKNWVFSILTDVFQTDTCMGEACAEIGREYVCCYFQGFEKAAYSFANPLPLVCTDSSFLTTFVLFVLLMMVSVLLVSLTIVVLFLYHRKKEESFEKISDPQ